MTYCPYLDDECTGSIPDCLTCSWALEFFKDECDDLDEQLSDEYDPLDDIEDVACFINFLDEHSNDFILEEDLFPKT